MYTKVYGCVWRWSSYVSVYFFIRCWFMWLYIIWYGFSIGFSMYSLSLFVNPFLVSRSHFVRFVDESLTVSWHLMPWQTCARVLYYIHNGGYMKRFAGIVASLVLPGLGQCFYGCFGWAFIFIVSTCLLGPGANVLSALHILFIDD